MNDDVPINLCINDDTEVHNALSKLVCFIIMIRFERIVSMLFKSLFIKNAFLLKVADTSYDAGCLKEVQCDTNEEIEDVSAYKILEIIIS